MPQTSALMIGMIAAARKAGRALSRDGVAATGWFNGNPFMWTQANGFTAATGSLYNPRAVADQGAVVVGLMMYCQWQPLMRLLESPVAAYIARISYALYIYHMLMIFGWMNMGSDWERYLLKRPVSFLLTFAAAHVSTFWWEQRWQDLAKKLTSRPARNSTIAPKTE